MGVLARMWRLLRPLAGRAAPPSFDLARVLGHRANGGALLDTRPAEEFARRHLKGAIGVGLQGRFAERVGSAENLELPVTLQGIIAARLDALSTQEKTLLQDASVVGKVFWTGAVGGEGDETEHDGSGHDD